MPNYKAWCKLDLDTVSFVAQCDKTQLSAFICACFCYWAETISKSFHWHFPWLHMALIKQQNNWKTPVAQQQRLATQLWPSKPIESPCHIEKRTFDACIGVQWRNQRDSPIIFISFAKRAFWNRFGNWSTSWTCPLWLHTAIATKAKGYQTWDNTKSVAGTNHVVVLFSRKSSEKIVHLNLSCIHLLI